MARLKEERPPFNVVQHLHRFVRKTISETDMFLTLVIAEIDMGTRTLIASNAGHQELLVWKQETRSFQSIPTHLPPVGFPVAEMTGDRTELKVPVAAGDRIILYTDGFPETLGQDGKIFGHQRLRQLVEKNIHLCAVDFLDEVFKAIDAFRADDPEDDRTLALVDIK
jgi:serine phosphatase RsbU (regulator of sigma subunit)